MLRWVFQNNPKNLAMNLQIREELIRHNVINSLNLLDKLILNKHVGI